MATSSEHVKRKRVAKNRKKAWRKHSNIQDIEEFIEDQRMQLRTGGIVSEKPDENIFFVDKQQPSQAEGLSKKSLQKPLKYLSKLLPDENAPLARRARTPKSVDRPKRTSKLKQRLAEEDKLRPSTLAKRRKLNAAKRESEKANKVKDDEQKRRECGRATYDIWGDTTPVDGTESSRVRRSEVAPSEHFLKVTKKTRMKVPKTYYKQPSRISAVEVVHPGASYNPTFEDHQALLQKAIGVELDRQKQENKLDRWHNFRKLSRQEMENNFLTEMTAGLFEGGAGIEGDGADDPDEAVPNAPVIAERRKTRSQRNKEKQFKQQIKKAKAEKANNIRMNEVYRLKALKKEIKAKEEKTAKKKAEKMAKAADNEGKTKRLGRYKYEEPIIPLKLTRQLVGSLRTLKPEGSLIADRYNSLQKRNLVEPRIWKKGTKPKMKEYEKKTFKEVPA